ncbi:winged helix-turn-helix domain-containing protein [Aquimarina brevivitae]|uniref:Molybdate transport system regulatory protein n=1 Tax=Aquimarina brevivitae TaxID=323412 RepID=A0A4Q7NZ44_9FLAO|nr:LysR family transcriptional regulator [Aquimarina brevivitae]RZS92527.1 molybdate transport system regulatory protein [Aquimarina brevivitae]
MYTIKSRIWIEGEAGVFLGYGRVSLLRFIHTEGSLSKAAKKMQISYKKAWSLIDSMNQNAKEPVVITVTGGNNGGGTFVTPYGLDMMNKFEAINKKCMAFLKDEIETLTSTDEH